MGRKAEEMQACLAAAEAALRESRAAVRKLQDLGHLHASQALSDLQKLCQLIGKQPAKSPSCNDIHELPDSI